MPFEGNKRYAERTGWEKSNHGGKGRDRHPFIGKSGGEPAQGKGAPGCQKVVKGWSKGGQKVVK